MSLLPKVPTDLQGRNKDYLIELVRQLEGELRRRPTTQEGQLIIASSRPLTYYDDAGVAYHMGEDVFPPGLGTSDLDTNGGEVVTVDGDPVLRDSGLAANGGSIPETDESNTFSGTQTVTNPVVLDGEGWTTPTLQNGWVTYGVEYGVPRFRKLPSGLVEVQGLIKDGTTTVGTVIFTLPAGYRPDQRLIQTTTSSSSHARFDIKADGTVVVDAGVSAAWLAINCTFFADQ